MASLTCRGVTVHHGGARALGPVDLAVGDGELIAVVGVSGSGKTTLLRAVAGLDRVSGGVVEIDGVDAAHLTAAERDVAMVFEQPALLPHRTIARNIAFPLEVRRRTVAEIRTRVAAEARALHIESLIERSPSDLASGEAQLVQVARALVRVPRVLVLDEPLVHLDTHLREHMRRELHVLQRGYGVTTLLTTNDASEAMSLGDRLVVLDDGVVVQIGAPVDVYRQPATLTVALLTGELATSDVGTQVLRGERVDGTRYLFDRATGHRVD